MFVIRKKLYASEGTDPNTRYDEDCECVQSTFDGGVTWVDNPAADPRTSAAFLDPNSADDVCAAAQGISNFVRQYVDGILINFNAIAVAAWSIQIGLIFLPPLGLMYRVAWLVAEGVISIGALTLDEAFDETVYDQIRDIAFCHLNAAGKFDDQAAFDAFGAQLQEDISNGAVNVLMALMFNMYGWVGFSNAALKYAEGADCSGAQCNWCHHWLLSEGAVDNLGITFLGGSITSNGAQGAVFGSSMLLTVDFEWDALVVEDMSFSFFCSAGGNGGTRNWQVFNGATSVRSGNIGQGAGGATINIGDLNVTTTRIRIQIHTSNNTAPNWVSDFTMSGKSSEQPFVENNC